MAYIGQGIKQGTFKVLDTSGNTYNGSNTTFSLGTQVGSAAQLLVSHDGVIQLPGTDYTLATGGTQITFSTAPASGASIFIVEISGAVGGKVTPSDTSVTADKLNSALLTGLTDIGAGIADADLFLVDDGAGGTLRKVAASRLSTYISPTSATDSFAITGSTPTLTIGDGGEEDTKLVFDGNAQDYYIGLDDSGDEFQIGKGSTLGAAREFSIGASGPVFNEDSDTHDFRIETDDQTHALFIHGARDEVSFNEDTADSSKGGLTLNQGDDDGIIFAMKSSDINHGVTNHQETDTYMAMAKVHATNGGGSITGISSDDIGMFVHGFAPSPDTSQDASVTAVVLMRANDLSGAGGANVGSTGNCFGVQNGGSNRFIVRGDGNIYSDSSHNTYDAFDDAQLVRAFDLSHGKGVIDSKFDKFVAYNHEKLAELELVGRHPKTNKPNHMVNVTGMQRLHNGAIWQQYEKHNQLLEAVYDLAKEAVGEEKANAILEKHDVKRLQ